MGALSDLAAMGAAPLGALVALCVPGGSGEGDVALGVMAGVAEAAAASGCPVVGGDVSEAGVLMVAVTVLGTVEGIGPPAVPRSGGQPGDVVLVTGPCGGSAAGLRALRAGHGHRRGVPAAGGPVARGRAGPPERGPRDDRRLRRTGASTCTGWPTPRGSGSGSTSVPVAEGATLDEALGGGEDYELVLVGDEEVSDHLCTEFVAAGLRQPFRLGSLVADPALRLLGGDALARLGWQHRLG